LDRGGFRQNLYPAAIGCTGGRGFTSCCKLNAVCVKDYLAASPIKAACPNDAALVDH
jgi:hypothetical protein